MLSCSHSTDCQKYDLQISNTKYLAVVNMSHPSWQSFMLQCLLLLLPLSTPNNTNFSSESRFRSKGPPLSPCKDGQGLWYIYATKVVPFELPSTKFAAMHAELRAYARSIFAISEEKSTNHSGISMRFPRLHSAE